MIHIHNLSFRASDSRVLNNIHLDVKPGEVVALIGPSGGGKSTLLRCINLLNQPDAGEILVDGQNMMDPHTDIYAIRRRIGFVFQEQSLFSNKMLIENVMMGPRDLLHQTRQEAFDTARRNLQLVGLGEKLYQFPSELSGGQKQRGEIARVLAMQPKIMLLDSITTSLDPVMTGEVNAVVSRLAQDGMTMLLATHDLQFCRNIADRVIYMDNGCIIEEGTPEELFSAPKDARTQAFVNQLRSLIYEIHSREFDLYELNSQIEAFGRAYFLSRVMVRNMELLVEELILHNLLEHTEQIRLQFRYLESQHTMQVCLTYSGEAYNPFDTQEDDPLSMLLVQQLTARQEYRYGGENTLELILKT